MLEELRITGLGVIESATLELGPGLTVITGETGAGKTMVVTALGLLLGGRADSGAVRSGSRTARVEGTLRVDALPEVAAAVDAAGGEVEGGRVLLARNVSAEGRSRAFVGGASVPVSTSCPMSPSRWSPSTARPTSTGSCSPAPSARRSTPSVASRSRRCWPTTAASTASCSTERELTEVVATARERAREADLLRFGLGEIEAVAPEAGEDAWLAEEEQRLGHADTLRTAAESVRRSRPTTAAPTRWPQWRRPARCSTAYATTTPRWPRSPTASSSSPICSPTSPPTSPPPPPVSTPTPAGCPTSPSAGPR